MHQRKNFTSNFLSMKYYLSKNFRTTVCCTKHAKAIGSLGTVPRNNFENCIRTLRLILVAFYVQE